MLNVYDKMKKDLNLKVIDYRKDSKESRLRTSGSAEIGKFGSGPFKTPTLALSSTGLTTSCALATDNLAQESLIQCPQLDSLILAHPDQKICLVLGFSTQNLLSHKIELL